MEAHVTIRGQCSAIIRRRRKLVPNQRYNINSNSYLLLRSMDTDVILGSLSANALVTSSVFDSNFFLFTLCSWCFCYYSGCYFLFLTKPYFTSHFNVIFTAICVCRLLIFTDLFSVSYFWVATRKFRFLFLLWPCCYFTNHFMEFSGLIFRGRLFFRILFLVWRCYFTSHFVVFFRHIFRLVMFFYLFSLEVHFFKIEYCKYPWSQL